MTSYHCKTCGHPVRRDTSGWVHYDDHFGGHAVDLHISEDRFVHSVAQSNEVRRSGQRINWHDELGVIAYIWFIVGMYLAIMWIGQYSPHTAGMLTVFVVVMHFLLRRR